MNKRNGNSPFKPNSATAGVMEEAAKGIGTGRMPMRAPRVTRIKSSKPVLVQVAKPERVEQAKYVKDNDKGTKYVLKNIVTRVMVRDTKTVQFRQWADPRNISGHRLDTLGRKRPSQVREHLTYQGMDGAGKAIWA